MANITLDGGEISIIKALGLTGSGLPGDQLQARVGDLEEAELIDTLKCMVALGYLIADRSSFSTREDFIRTTFHVNSGYSKEIKEAMDPNSERPKRRRMRRE
jgi:hypothetical protein